MALTLPSLTSEFGPSTTQVRYTTCSIFVGLCVGASFWGIASDILGRRLAFNTTLFIAGVFGLAVGGGDSWIGVCGLYAALGVGVGGNLPVDGVRPKIPQRLSKLTVPRHSFSNSFHKLLRRCLLYYRFGGPSDSSLARSVSMPLALHRLPLTLRSRVGVPYQL